MSGRALAARAHSPGEVGTSSWDGQVPFCSRARAERTLDVPRYTERSAQDDGPNKHKQGPPLGHSGPATRQPEIRRIGREKRNVGRPGRTPFPRKLKCPKHVFCTIPQKGKETHFLHNLGLSKNCVFLYSKTVQKSYLRFADCASDCASLCRGVGRLGLGCMLVFLCTFYPVRPACSRRGLLRFFYLRDFSSLSRVFSFDKPWTQGPRSQGLASQGALSLKVLGSQGSWSRGLGFQGAFCL